MIQDATYRIRTSANPAMYFQIDGSTGDVVPKALNTALDTQKWKIRNNAADNTYILTNVGTQTQLSVRDSGDKDDNGNILYKLATFDTGLAWTLESRGPNFVIGLPTGNTCVDFSVDTKLLLWARNDLPNQRWILEQIAGTIVPPQTPSNWPQHAASPGRLGLYNLATFTVEIYVSNESRKPPTAGAWYKVEPQKCVFIGIGTGPEAVAVRTLGGAPAEPEAVTTGGFVQPGTVVTFRGFYPHPGLIIANKP
jgi:hypothetical protein